MDTPPGFTPEVIATIDASSSICMLGMLDAPSLKNTKLGLETLQLMGYAMGNVRIVLNRATPASASRTRTSSTCWAASRRPGPQPARGRALDQRRRADRAGRKSEPAKAFRALAELYAADRRPAPVADGRRRRLLRKG